MRISSLQWLLVSVLAAGSLHCGEVTTRVRPSTKLDSGTKLPADEGLDTTPPTFAGLIAATASGSNITLVWDSGSDNTTASVDLMYRVYMAVRTGGQDFTTPSAATLAGETQSLFSGLSAGNYYFVVRAVDAMGNEEKNQVEKFATVLK